MVQLIEVYSNGGNCADNQFLQAAMSLPANSYLQGRNALNEGRGTCRSFRPARKRRYGIPASDFPPSRLVKYSPKHQYSRLLNFPYLGAHFQPRMNTIVVQVQGISRFNDTSNPNSVASFGVFFGPQCVHNSSFPLPILFKQTQNRAVLESIRCALAQVVQMRHTEFIPGWKELIIMTDSEYAKKSLSTWVWRWEKNGWNKADQNAVIENVKAMQDLHNLITYMERCLDMSVRFWKVGREDIAGADELAKRAMDNVIDA